jgi:hypothetical protein
MNGYGRATEWPDAGPTPDGRLPSRDQQVANHELDVNLARQELTEAGFVVVRSVDFRTRAGTRNVADSLGATALGPLACPAHVERHCAYWIGYGACGSPPIESADEDSPRRARDQLGQGGRRSGPDCGGPGAAVKVRVHQETVRRYDCGSSPLRTTTIRSPLRVAN